jgi:4-amino-4-deoxy-L-arabinose transferase-like glycosyltransferase
LLLLNSEKRSGVLTSVEARSLLYIFLLALVVRLIFVFFYSWVPDDALGYDTLAHNILQGNGFSFQRKPPFEPTLYRTPVYPYFLSALYGVFGFHEKVVYLAQAVIGALTCCLIYSVARRYLTERAAWLVALVNAVYPFTARFVAARLSETLFTFLLCATIYLVVCAYQKEDWRWMTASGAMLGVAILCRPENMFFPFFLASLFLLAHRFRWRWWKLSGALVACTLLVLMPWMIRNYQITGKVGPLVRYGPGVAFWQTTLPYFDPNTLKYAPGSDEHDPIVWQLTHNKTMTEADLAGLEPKMWRAGIENMRRDPKAYLVRRLKEYPHLWISGGDYLLGDHNRAYGQALAEGRYFLIATKMILLLVVGIVPLVLAVTGLLINRKRLIELLPLWAYPLYVTVTRLPFDIAPRNTLPAHPFMLIFAVCGALYLWGLYTKRRNAENAGKLAEPQFMKS